MNIQAAQWVKGRGTQEDKTRIPICIMHRIFSGMFVLLCLAAGPGCASHTEMRAAYEHIELWRASNPLLFQRSRRIAILKSNPPLIREDGTLFVPPNSIYVDVVGMVVGDRPFPKSPPVLLKMDWKQVPKKGPGTFGARIKIGPAESHEANKTPQ